MTEAIVVVLLVIIAVLAFFLFRKFREISSWKDEDPITGDSKSSSAPQELRDLRIEEPSSDALNLTGDDKTPGKGAPPEKH